MPPTDSSAAETTQTETAATTATETTTSTASSETTAATTQAETQQDTATSVVPEKYEITLPTDSKLDASLVERTAAIARELGLSNAHAQSLLDKVAAELTTAETTISDRLTAEREAAIAAEKPGGANWLARTEKWQSEILADKEIGGTPENMSASVERAKSVLSKFFPPETLEFLNESGMGSHPAVVKGFARIGKAMAEGSLVMPGAEKAGSSDSDVLNRMYDHPTSRGQA